MNETWHRLANPVRCFSIRRKGFGRLTWGGETGCMAQEIAAAQCFWCRASPGGFARNRRGAAAIKASAPRLYFIPIIFLRMTLLGKLFPDKFSVCNGKTMSAFRASLLWHLGSNLRIECSKCRLNSCHTQAANKEENRNNSNMGKAHVTLHLFFFCSNLFRIE